MSGKSSSASVSVGGTAPNQTLTFTIPRGDTGATGEQGLKGDTGNPGQDGQDALWNYTGAYNGGTAYAVGDLAFFGGQLFYRKNSNGGNVGDNPFDGSSFWDLLASKGDQGDIGETGPTGPTGSTGPTGPQPSLTITDNATTAITLADAMTNQVIRCTAAAAVTVTVPSTLAAGFSCMVIQAGAGQVTFAAGSGTTLNSFGALLRTAGQHAPASLIRVATGVYNLSGNLV